MNPLKNLLKVFEATPPAKAREAQGEDAAFEWNPEEEVVAPTSARATSWKRSDAADDVARRTPEPTQEASGLHQPPPAPVFEPHASAEPVAATSATLTMAAPAAPEEAPYIAFKAAPPAVVAAEPSEPTGPAAAPVHPAQSTIPLSDFEDVYRKAGIKSPVHGYGVERVYRLLTSRRLAGLDRNVRRSALLTALDAAGVPASDVAQDAVLRRKALAAYEAEKALELQSLRSRNESRVEALQDTVETFTRQKQAQIERLAQGSTAAVRSQSDLEIRKRMEQDRLYRSLAYFVEPLPAVEQAALPAAVEPPASRFSDTVEVAPIVSAAAEVAPASAAGFEAALRAAAQEARSAGWGQTNVSSDGGADAAEALRRLRESGTPESES